jgi:hypothetical protein
MSLRHKPDPFLDSFTGLVIARALSSATVLGVFDTLHESPLDPRELAERLGIDADGADVLLVTLETINYVEVDDAGRYRNAEITERLLVSTSPESIAAFVGRQGDLHWRVLSQLPAAVRDGEAYEMHEGRRGDAGDWEAYMRGLFQIARRENKLDANLVPVEAPRRLVDIAGGHGGFSIAMCKRFEDLEATIVDLPPSAAVGRKIVAEQGFGERIDFREGDVFEVGLGDGVDVISTFNLVHHLSDERNRELCRLGREALAPGGCMVIGDAAAPEEGEPVSEPGAISSLLFYAWSHGRNYKPSQMRSWMEDAGFEEVVVHRNLLTMWRVVLIGR